MIHTEALDCPCVPETRDQVGGGRVAVHRTHANTDGRPTETNRAPDRICPVCAGWHNLGHWHLEMSHDDQIRARLLRALEDEVRTLRAEGQRHVGLFVERQAVIALLDPRREKQAAA